MTPTITITNAQGDTIPAGAEVLSGTTVILSVSGLPENQSYAYEWTGNFTPASGNAASIEVTIPVDPNRIDELLDYSVVVTPGSTGCPVIENTSLNRAKSSYKLPDVITPNGDGTNDFFRLFYRGVVENYQVAIFNRWGQKVFSSSDPNQDWDGTLNGKAQNMDIYLFVMVFDLDGARIEEDGSFSLIR